MWILRFLLFVICALCLGWSILVFGGPTLIKWTIISYSDGRVTPSNITVTPKLDVRISRLDFDFSDEDVLRPFVGFSRSVNLDWSLFDDQAFLEVQLGPTFLENIMRAERIKFYTPSYENIDLDKILFDIEVENFSGNSFGKAAILTGQNFYLPEKSMISDLSFKLRDLVSEKTGLWEVELAEGTVGNFSLNLPLDEQNVLVNFSAEQLSSATLKVQAPNINGDITGREGEFGFDLKFAEMFATNFGGNVGPVKIVGSLDDKGSLNQLQIEALNGVFDEQSLSFSSVTTDLSKTGPQNYTAQLTASLGKLDVTIGDNYWGSLPDSRIDIELNLDEAASKISATTNLNLTNAKEPNVTGLGQLNAKLKNETDLWDCLAAQCALSDFRFDYQINLDQQSVRGKSVCITSKCAFGDMKNTITTSDTTRVFEALGRSKMLNPFILAYIYAAISAGEPIGQGHEFQF